MYKRQVGIDPLKHIPTFEHIPSCSFWEQTGKSPDGKRTCRCLIYNTPGDDDELVILLEDITDATRSREQLDDFEHLFNLVSDFAHVGCVSYNPLTGEGYTKGPWAKNYGEAENTPASQILGHWRQVHPDDRQHLEEEFERLKTGEIRTFVNEVRIVSDQEPMRWIKIHLLCRDYRPEEGVIDLACVNYDISELKRTEEEELREAKKRAEESNKLKSAFLANMSHEIRTPLNAIVGFSSLMQSEELSQEERAEYCAIVVSNSEMLLTLLNDILDISSLECGKIRFNYASEDIVQICRHVMMTTAHTRQRGVEGRFACPVGSFMLTTDAHRLSQILINLLTNAAKFTAKGSIRFGYRAEGSRLRFYVSDTGCGIPPEGQRRIFDRFVKLNSFKQGTGLGLPICKSIVEHLGGEIGVKSEEGRGTTFWFTLPYVTGKPCETPCGEIPTVSVEKDKLTILIAEDNDSNYRLFETILRRDYRLIHARDGEQAVELCRTEHPHLILMDINMPVMNGYEAAAEIRKFAAEIPIVAVTAYAYASDEQKIMQNGFTGYMPKPINAPQLKKQILDILRERITLI